jgi:hypothetical protein
LAVNPVVDTPPGDFTVGVASCVCAETALAIIVINKIANIVVIFVLMLI